MKDQLQTIREALEIFGRVFVGPYSASKASKALAALAQLEAMTVAQQPQCHKRANDYCKCNRKAMLCDGFGSAQQPQATCITITHAQAAELMLMFSGAEPDTEITLLTGDGHSGPGLYAYYEEYPEEGAEKLDATELPAQQPQADQSLRQDALQSLAYANSAKAGWNLAVADDEAGFAKIMDQVPEAVRTLKQKRAEQPQAEAVPDDLRDRLVAIGQAIADQDDRAAQAMIREILAAPQQAEAVQACGHSMSLLLRSAESNAPLYCEACDDKSGRHDAERRETELLDANRRLQEKIGSADALKLHAIEELCQLGYTVKDGELFPPDHLHKLMEAAGHPLAVRKGGAA